MKINIYIIFTTEKKYLFSYLKLLQSHGYLNKKKGESLQHLNDQNHSTWIYFKTDPLVTAAFKIV